MMLKLVTYTQVERALEQLGFQRHVIPGSHVYFENLAHSSIIMLPLYAGPERASAAHLIAIKKNLTEKGVLDSEHFEELLTEGQNTSVGAA